MSGDSIVEPFLTMFKMCLKCGIFLGNWKIGSIVPIFKKDDKQNIKNYRPVSLLPIFGEVSKRIMYGNKLKFFLYNNQISQKQSGFRHGDFYLNQLPSITHNICPSFLNGLEERGVFLDICESFDKVWHDGLMYKLTNSIKDKLRCLLIEKSATNFKWSVLIMDKS